MKWWKDLMHLHSIILYFFVDDTTTVGTS